MREYWLIDEDGDAVGVVPQHYVPMAGELVVPVEVKGIPQDEFENASDDLTSWRAEQPERPPTIKEFVGGLPDGLDDVERFVDNVAAYEEMMRKTQADTEFEENGNVGDVNSTERGSGARFNAGKPKMHLLPMHLLVSTVRVLEYGAEKYAAWNWAKGMDWSIPLDCMTRHMMALQRGEMHDAESGQPHWAHIICNAIMLEHFYHTYPEGNDLVDPEVFK